MARALRFALVALLVSATGVLAQAVGLRVNDLLGMAVTDRSGAAIGEVKELMLELETGRVHYAVLELPALGMGEKQFAYPVTVLAPGKRETLVLNVPRGEIENSEGFDRGRWPAGSDEYWSRIERRYRGHETNGSELAALDPRAPARTQAERKARRDDASASASAGQSPGGDLVRASHLLGMEVMDRSGAVAGSVTDIVVSLRDARVRHLVMETARSQRSVSVPVSNVVLEPNARSLSLKADAKRPM